MYLLLIFISTLLIKRMKAASKQKNALITKTKNQEMANLVKDKRDPNFLKNLTASISE